MTDASSWSTNICIAEFFASSYEGKYGYVVEYEAVPDDVVIDTRLLKESILDELTLTGANQSEVLLDRRKRKVTVIMLLHNREYVKRIE
jgi:hypothetical protein